ncbi:GYD domain-containing protein [Cognatilysobacter segetis]|uniref:GYD domain-containing protein n=2 Tax=Cognatilysobacter segetis TaxID=2492394 RepID=UPI0010622F8F|nr:GYD domain-containing protein [Lysobacter segetis]
MPTFITQGRYTPDAVRGMLQNPEDRAQAIAELFEQSGGKLIGYYMTFGDHDFVVISEGPLEGVAVSTVVVEAMGEVTDLQTSLAISSTEMKDALGRAGAIASRFRTLGGAMPRAVASP